MVYDLETIKDIGTIYKGIAEEFGAITKLESLTCVLVTEDYNKILTEDGQYLIELNLVTYMLATEDDYKILTEDETYRIIL